MPVGRNLVANQVLEPKSGWLSAGKDRALDVGRQERETKQAPLIAGAGNSLDDGRTITRKLDHGVGSAKRLDQDRVTTACRARGRTDRSASVAGSERRRKVEIDQLVIGLVGFDRLV